MTTNRIGANFSGWLITGNGVSRPHRWGSTCQYVEVHMSVTVLRTHAVAHLSP